MRRSLTVAWSTAIVIWVLICAGGWVVATRDDYAKLDSARACYSASLQSQLTASRCENTKPSDILFYKAAIGRKARISSIAAALGGGMAIALLILVN